MESGSSLLSMVNSGQVGRALQCGAGVGKVREEPRGQGLGNAGGDAFLEVVD